MISYSDVLVIGIIGGGICLWAFITSICFEIYHWIEKRGGIYDEES